MHLLMGGDNANAKVLMKPFHHKIISSWNVKAITVWSAAAGKIYQNVSDDRN